MTACQADGIGTNTWKGLDRAFVDKVKAAGGSHHVWTVDDVRTARRFLDLGTASVTTNRPGALRTALEKQAPSGR